MRISNRWSHWDFRRLCCRALMLILATASLQAQVVLDGSVRARNPNLPAPTGPSYQIPAGLGEKDSSGINLFHSFKQFDLSRGDTAYFTGEGARNILARVTSQRGSSIDGTISSDTNLFFMNPAGITFGEHSSIDVKGSFFATTADFIRLGNDGKFGTTLSASDKILTSSDPAAFGFLTPTPAAIRILGSTAGKTFTGPNVKTLGLIGGDVSVESGVTIQAEDVQIVSVRAKGEAALQLPNGTNGLLRPSINAENFSAHGAISVTGEPLNPQLTSASAVIQAQRVVIRGGTFVMKNATIQTSTNGPGDGLQAKVNGSFELNAHSLIDSVNYGDMAGSAAVEIAAGSAVIGKLSQISSETGPAGAGGEIKLTIRGALQIVDEGAISSDSYSLTRGGDIAVSADSIALDSLGRILAHSNDIGKTGDISINAAGLLSITGNSKVSIQPQPPPDMTTTAVGGETITATAGEILISGANSGFFYQDTSTQGVSGTINLNSRGLLSINDGGLVSALAIGRDGASVNIQAANVAISGAGVSDSQETGITAKSSAGPGTRGGEIQLTVAGSLSVLDGGVISTDAFGGGNGGSINIAATDVTVTGRGGMLPNFTDIPRGITARNRSNDPSQMSGPGGSVRLTLSGQLEVRDAGEIIVDTNGPGAGGSVEIRAKDASIETLGTVAARTLSSENGGPGGDVSFDVSGLLAVGSDGLISVSTVSSGAAGAINIRGGAVQVSGTEARITAVSGAPGVPATGRSGAVSLDVEQLTLADNGQITASTYGAGAGGDLHVKAGNVQIQGSGGGEFAGLSAQTLDPISGGPGGSVQIETQTLTMQGAGAAITTQSLGSGNSGRIQIATNTISMSDGSMIQSSSTSTGRAGSIAIDAKGDITLSGGSLLSVAAAQSDAGDIQVRSGTSIDLTDSSITAQAALNGGSIDLRARGLLLLTNSQITAAAGLNGGNIFIDPHLVVLEDSIVSANAIRGRGGNVRIISDFFLAPPGSSVTATSELGIDGTVQIDAINDDLTGSLVELPASLLNAESLLRDLCTVKIDKFSSFISEGRGGLPPLPGEALPSLQIVR